MHLKLPKTVKVLGAGFCPFDGRRLNFAFSIWIASDRGIGEFHNSTLFPHQYGKCVLKIAIGSGSVLGRRPRLRVLHQCGGVADDLTGGALPEGVFR